MTTNIIKRSANQAKTAQSDLVTSTVQGKPRLLPSAVQGKSRLLPTTTVRGKPRLLPVIVQGKPRLLPSSTVQGKPRLLPATVQGKPRLSSSTVQGHSTTSPSTIQYQLPKSAVQHQQPTPIVPKKLPIIFLGSVNVAPKLQNTLNNQVELPAKPTSTPTSTIGFNSGGDGRYDNAYYDIRVSQVEMQRFLGQNRIYPKDGKLFLRDSA